MPFRNGTIIVSAPTAGAKVVERALEPESLDRKQHDVERFGRRARDEHARLQIDVAMRTEDPETLAPELFGASGRTRKVTSRPAWASRAPKYPPVAPAPTIRMRMGSGSLARRRQGRQCASVGPRRTCNAAQGAVYGVTTA